MKSIRDRLKKATTRVTVKKLVKLVESPTYRFACNKTRNQCKKIADAKLLTLD
jgi:hypothetical protein